MSFAQEMKDAEGTFKAGSNIVQGFEKNQLNSQKTAANNSFLNTKADYYNHFGATNAAGQSSSAAPVDGATVAGNAAKNTYENSSPPTDPVPAVPPQPVMPTTVPPPPAATPSPVTTGAIPVPPPPSAYAYGSGAPTPGSGSYARGGMVRAFDDGGAVPLPTWSDMPAQAGVNAAGQPPSDDDTPPTQVAASQPVAAPIPLPPARSAPPVVVAGKVQKSTALPVPQDPQGQPTGVYPGSIPNTMSNSQIDMPESILGSAVHGALHFIQNIFGLGGGGSSQQAAPVRAANGDIVDNPTGPLPAYDPRMGNNLTYDDGTPYPLDPNTGQPIPGAREGQTPAGASVGANPVPAPQAANPNHGVMMLSQHVGAMSQSEFDQVRKIVDPKGQLDDQLGNVAAINGMYNYYMSQGDEAKANQAAASVVMTLGKISSQLGAQAEDAVKSGKYPQAAALLKKAYDYIPDGNTASVNGNQVSITDANGNILHQGTFTPHQLLDAATGIKNGSTFWNQLIQTTAKKNGMKPEQVQGYEAPPQSAADRAGLQAAGLIGPDGQPVGQPQVADGSDPTTPPSPPTLAQTPQGTGLTGIPASAVQPATTPVSAPPPAPGNAVAQLPASPTAEPGPVTQPGNASMQVASADGSSSAPSTPTPSAIPVTPGVAMAATVPPPPTAAPNAPAAYSVSPDEVTADGGPAPKMPPAPQYVGPMNAIDTSQMSRPAAREVDKVIAQNKQSVAIVNKQANEQYKAAMAEYNQSRKDSGWKPEKLQGENVENASTAVNTAIQTAITQLPDPATGKPIGDADAATKLLGNSAVTGVHDVALGLMVGNPNNPALQTGDGAAHWALNLAINPSNPAQPNWTDPHYLVGRQGVQVTVQPDPRAPPIKIILPTASFSQLVSVHADLAQKLAAAQQVASTLASSTGAGKSKIMDALSKAPDLAAGALDQFVTDAKNVGQATSDLVNNTPSTEGMPTVQQRALDLAKGMYSGVTNPRGGPPAPAAYGYSSTSGAPDTGLGPITPAGTTPAAIPPANQSHVTPIQLRAIMEKQYPGITITNQMLQDRYQALQKAGTAGPVGTSPQPR